MIRFQREWMAFNEVAGFLYSPHCCEELTIEGVVVALCRGQCLGVESHWQPFLVVVVSAAPMWVAEASVTSWILAVALGSCSVVALTKACFES